MRLGLALPQYDYSLDESPLPWDSMVEFAVAAERAGYDSLWLSDHLVLDVAKYGGPPDQRGVLRSDRLARRALAHGDAPVPRHARAVRGAAPRVGAGQVARHPRPHLRRPARRRHRRRLVRARVRAHRHGHAAAERTAGAAPRGDRGVSRPARRRAVHVRRRPPPVLDGAEPAARGPGADAADHRRRQGRPAAGRSSPRSPTAGTRAGCGRPTRTASGSTCSSGPAKRSTAIRRR